MAILKPDKTTPIGTGLNVNEYLLTKHNPNKIALPAKRTAAQPLIGVTLHNTDWLNVAAGTTPAEQYTRATVNGNMGDTRVHYYVDDKCAWKNLGDEYTSWHSATGGQGQGNCNTISIESIMRNQTDAVSVASMENTAKLIAWIFGQYGWTVEKNLYTHNYWTNYKDTGAMSADLDAQSLKKCTSKTANPSGKYCPVYILPQWEKFKALVKKYMGNATKPADTVKPTKSTTAASSSTTTTKIGNGTVVEIKSGSVYYPGSSAVPVWAVSDFYHVVSGDKKTVKGGAECVLLGEKINKKTGKKEAGINSWIDITALSVVSDAAVAATKEIGVGDVVAIKNGTKTYYPGGVNIPDWVILDFYHKVTQTEVDGKPVTKGGVKCVLLGKKVNKTRGTESEGINSWIAADALTIIRKA